MGIVRVHKKENPYVIIDKTGINDVRLSWKARGLLCYLLSKPNDWKVNVKHLAEQGPDGEWAVRSGLKELERYGYMVTRPLRDEKGRIIEWEHNIFEVPRADNKAPDEPDAENRDKGNPDLENLNVDYPDVENRNLDNNIVNNELLNNDFNNISVSVSQSFTENKNCIEDKEEKKETDGLTEKKTGAIQADIKEFEEILGNCCPEFFDTPEAIKGALEDMYFGRAFSKRFGVPAEIVRKKMKKLHHDIIRYAVYKMEKAAAEGAEIRNSLRYLQVCIYNAISEYESDLLADEYLAWRKMERRKSDRVRDG